MSQAFCNGIPFGETVNGVPSTPCRSPTPTASSSPSRASIPALTYLTATDAGTVDVKNAALVARARAQVDLGDFAGAAATVASVPTSFQYNFDYSVTTFDNEWWVMGASVKRYVPGDSVDVAGRSSTRFRSRA